MSRLVGVADRERIDVEVPRPHQAGDAVEDAGLVEDEGDEHVAVGAPAPGSARGGGAAPEPATASAGPPAPAVRVGSSSFVRPAPLLDQVGQALAGRHHREDVLLLGDLEPDERRAVDPLGEADRIVHLVRGRAPSRPGSRTRRRA